MITMESNIQKNYPAQWEGKTKGGISKRIFAIVGKILPITYKRLIDKDGIYLNDNQNNQLLVQNDYETNENS